MRSRLRATYLLTGAALACIAVAAWLGSGDEAAPSGLLLFTEVSAGMEVSTDGVGYPAESRISAVDPQDPQNTLRVLTGDFEAARAPYVHFDGRRMVFAAQREVGGPWQIWEMNLATGKSTLVVPGCVRCSDPIYLPDDRIAYASVIEGTLKSALFVAEAGASGERITFHPESDDALSLLSDGRILFRVADGGLHGGSSYWAVRYDGTGAERVYTPYGFAQLVGAARELPDRALMFAEVPPDGHDGRLTSISLAYPAEGRVRVAPEQSGSFASAAVLEDGRLVASYRDAGDAAFGLWIVRTDQGAVSEKIRTNDGFHALEPVLAAAWQRPLGFVTATDLSASAGGVYCIDANRSDIPAGDRASAVRVKSPQGFIGEALLATDGSFNIEIPHDVPLRFETVDDRGRIVRGPSDWVWVRPGEVRGCVGCHVDRAYAPPNVLPEAITAPAISLVSAQVVAAPEQGEGTR